MSELLSRLLGRTFRAEDPDDPGTGREAPDDLDEGLDRGDDLASGDGKDDDSDDSVDDDFGDDDDADDDEDELDVGKGDDDDDSKDKKKAASQSIPIARFNEAQRKSREKLAQLQAEIDALKNDKNEKTSTEDAANLDAEIEALETKYTALVKDGDTDAAAAVRREIRQKERQTVLMLSEKSSSTARAMAVEQVKVDLIIEKLEAAHPQLNPDSDEYDEDIVSLVSAARKGYEASGMSSSSALEKASSEIMRRIAKLAPPEKEEVDKGKRGLGADNVSSRRGKQLAKNLKDVKDAAPDTKDIGLDSNSKGGGADTKSVMDMSDEDLEALPKSTLAKLRGDVLTS